ncbi:MAG: helix-turn-helix domain-containing protein [Janthinobacterium lividum]
MTASQLMDPSRIDGMAERLHQRRRQVGLSQSQLAELTGISAANISHYECNRHSPALSAIVCIARELAVTTDWLLVGKLDEVRRHAGVRNASGVRKKMMRDTDFSCPKD